MVSNRRRSSRVTDDLIARWHRRGHTVEARLVDCSVHGFLLLTDETLPVNQVMDLETVLPEGPVSFLATSRFVGQTRRGHGIGVQILLSTPEDMQRWMAHYQMVVGRATNVRADGTVPHAVRGSRVA